MSRSMLNVNGDNKNMHCSFSNSHAVGTWKTVINFVAS